MNFCKEKIKIIFAGALLSTIIFSGTVFGAEEEFKLNTNDAFKEWESLSNEEKKETIMPRSFDVNIPDSVLKKNEKNESSLKNIFLRLFGIDKSQNSVSAVNYSRYNLADNLNIRVENQQSTSECWAFSVIKSLETNLALKSGSSKIMDFSERHMDYATSRTFLDGINQEGFNREVGSGGLLLSALAYLTNGQGAVLETEMPFVNSEEKINLEEIDKPVDTIVNDYAILPTIHKEYTKDNRGNTTSVKYYNIDGGEYTNQEVEALRNIIKQHIIDNGAIASMTGGSMPEFYEKPDSMFSSKSYNCNDSSRIRDHAITIVGWDDEYSRNNFPDGIRPSTDGAYIVLNSYGTTSFDKGYIYISYEDYFIEQEIYGIESTSKVNYDNLYQADFYGGVYQIGLPYTNEGYYGINYSRDSQKGEILDSVGITLCDYCNVEIYVNPYDNEFDKNKLIKVASTSDYLDPGYHRIDITPTKLEGENFTIVVKQKAESNNFYFEVEAKVENSPFSLVTSNNRCFVSVNGNTWTNITNLNVKGVDMYTSDLCIKAFTKDVEPENQEIKTNKYSVDKNNIMNISAGTTVNSLFENLNSDYEKEVLNSDSSATLQDNEIIKTGMKLKLSNGSVYTLIVRGDLNKDGRVSILDVSKLILIYNEDKDFYIDEEGMKAADMNIDGKVSIIDLSQIIILYNDVT